MKIPTGSARNTTFVALALVSSLSRWLSSHITMQIGHEWLNNEGTGAWPALLPSFCMSSFLTSAVHLATRTPSKTWLIWTFCSTNSEFTCRWWVSFRSAATLALKIGQSASQRL